MEKEVNKEILKDADGIVHYLDIHKQLSWRHFKNISKWVKNNIGDSNFDAALVVLYGRQVRDLVRIYLSDPQIARLEEIRQKFIDGIQRTD